MQRINTEKSEDPEFSSLSVSIQITMQEYFGLFDFSIYCVVRYSTVCYYMVAKCYGLVERPGSIIGGPDARFLFDKLQLNMKELSIFVDESGDFGKYDFHSPYYILAFVFHDQENDISEEIAVLNHKLSKYGLQNRAVHTGPVIRKEEEYSAFTIEDRRTIMRHLISFYRHAEINCTAVHIEKKHIGAPENMAAALAAKISAFITKYLTVFQSFDVVKI